MAVITTIVCDCGCKRRLEISNTEATEGAEELIQITDAMGERLNFVTTECFKKFAANYTCPYPPRGAEPKTTGDLDDILPGAAN